MDMYVCLMCLSGCSWSVCVQVLMASKGVIEAVVALMRRHPLHEGVQEAGFAVCCNLSNAAENKVRERALGAESSGRRWSRMVIDPTIVSEWFCALLQFDCITASSSSRCVLSFILLICTHSLFVSFSRSVFLLLLFFFLFRSHAGAAAIGGCPGGRACGHAGLSNQRWHPKMGPTGARQDVDVTACAAYACG